MSLAPYLFRDLLHYGWFRPLRLLDYHLGSNYQWMKHAFNNVDPGVKITAENDKFEVAIDVQHFKPNEITVKTVNDNSVVIEAKHESRQDEHGYIFRQFSRRYLLPPGHDIKNIVSKLSSDGVLTVTAPKLVAEKKTDKERVIPITETKEQLKEKN